MERLSDGTVVWPGDRPAILLGLVAFITMLLTALVIMVFADASVRHFVTDCTRGGGNVQVVERQLVCLGGKL